MEATKKPGDYRSMRESLSKMTWKQRLEHIWMYYKWGIIIGALGIFILAGVVSSMVANRVDTLFSGYVVNMYPTAEGEAYLTTQYLDALGGVAGKQQVDLTSATGISMEEMAASTVGVDTGVQVSAMMGAGSLDYVVMDEIGLEYFIGQSAFAPVTDLLTAAQMDGLQEDLVYYTDDAGQTMPLALEITGTSFAQQCLQHDGAIYIAFPASSPHRETVSDFFDYLLAWDGDPS